MTKSDRAPALRLLDYYLIEGVSAFCASLFLLSIFFWARAKFDFSNTENLLLGAVQGLAHITGSNIGGRLGDRLGYTRMLGVGLCGVALTSSLGWSLDHHWIPYVVTGAYGLSIGMTWPALEAGAMHIPGRLNMPQRVGVYNLVWSFSGTCGFALSGYAFEINPDSIFWISGFFHTVQLLWILVQRGRHEPVGDTAEHIPHSGKAIAVESRVYFRNLAWLSNGLGYFLAGAFGALTPHLGDVHGLSAAWTIWLGSSLLLSRAFGFAILYRWKAWHYRRGWSLYALASAPVFLAAIFFVKSLPVVLIACLGMGFSFALSYSMSLYYSLDSSSRQGEQGGWHESMIGLGILGGPLIGAAGGAASGSTAGAKAAIVAAALLVTGAGYLLLAGKNARLKRAGKIDKDYPVA